MMSDCLDPTPQRSLVEDGNCRTNNTVLTPAQALTAASGVMMASPESSLPIATRRRTTQSDRSTLRRNCSSALLIAVLSALLSTSTRTTTTCAFSTYVVQTTTRPNVKLLLAAAAASSPDDDIARLQAKARALLEKSKAKLAASEEEEQLEEEPQLLQPLQELNGSREEEKTATEPSTNGAAASLPSKKSSSSLPFFAARSTVEAPVKRQAVTKTINEQTGLITTDGEKMAQYSEQEEWERRPLSEVFENELSDDDDVYSQASQQLAQRDVAASIWNLRKELQQGDYQRIFDKRNRFIGEVE